MALDFNIAPYYDDYSQSKNFYRILFKPGRAVQARELTQLQTILQKQIESMGTNIFKEGSLVFNGKSFVTKGLFLRLDTVSVDVNIFEGEVIVGATSGARALVKKVSVATSTEPAKLFIVNPDGVFQNGEDVTIVDTTTSVTVESDESTFTGPVYFFSIEESIFYTKGNFVYCDPQTIVVPATLNINIPLPSARIGLQVVESIINSDDDSSLLDPAIGTNNYFAPGADRYQIELILKGIEYNPTVENSDQETITDFIDICNIRYGETIKLVTSSEYNVLQDALALRTYDESGDYTVKPFIATIKDHVFLDNTKFTLELTPGKAYVKGYAFETTAPLFLTLDKARDIETVNNFPIAADYSTYVRVSNVSGFINPLVSQQFDVHNVDIANVVLTSNVNYANTIIGNVRVRYFEDINVGATDATKQYRFYFYDSHIFDYQASNVRVTLNGSGYNVNAQNNTTVTIATSGPVQPKVNATATASYTGNAILGITLTNIGRGYTSEAINNTTVTIATTGPVQPTVNATATINFVENSFSNAKSFVNVEKITASPNIVAAVDIYDPANVRVTYGEDDTLLFPVPQSTIATFKPNNVSDTSFTSVKLFTASFTNSTGVNSAATITLTGDETFIGTGNLDDDDINVRFWGAVTAAGTSSLTKKSKLNFNNTHSYVNISGDGKTAILQVEHDGGSFTANVLGQVYTSSAAGKQKVLTTGNVTVPYGSDTGNISLGVSDVYDIVYVLDYIGLNDTDGATGNSYIGRYTFDNGQRDDFYDHGKLTLLSNVSAPVLNSTDNANLTVQFRYFAHTGTGFFSADSYTGSGITYEQIPSYTSSKGITYPLSDVLDFRPVRAASANTVNFTNVVEPGSVISADYSYYLGRIDKVVITKEQKIQVFKGIPSLSPDVPKDNPQAMSIYTVEIPAYTKKVSDVKLGFIDNKRYTMRDIGKIERRVSRLEYYTALSFLEKIASDQRIPSSVPGVDRFKNGILVDPFAGHGVGDVTNKDYVCSIDSDLRYLRPAFVSDSYNYVVQVGESSNYNQTGDLITPPYTESEYISQTQASRNTFLTPHEVFTYIGEMQLNPATDIWHDRETLPAVTVNINGENDAFTQIVPTSQGLSPWVTKWNDWKSIGRYLTDVDVSVNVSTSTSTKLSIDAAGNLSAQNSTQSSATTTVNKTYGESFVKTGLQFNAAQKVITTNFGETIKDASLVPYIRSRPITFVAKNLRPNTTLYATFNDTDVTDYVFPAIELKFSTDLPTNVKLTRVYTASSSANVVLHGKDRCYVVPDVTKAPLTTGTVDIEVLGGAPIERSLSSIRVPTELATNQYGEAAGVFVIPNNDELKFYIGERPFKLVDSLDKTFVTTAAQTNYLAHGLSTTAQDTILATRMNLVSIDPLVDTKQTSGGSTTTTKTTTSTTVGEISTVSLPPTQPGAGSFGTQDFFCGQNKKSSGKQGTYTFRINLGEGSLGEANVTVRSFNVPDRFTLTYAGSQQTSGFMTNTTDATTVENYNTTLNKLGYPDVSRTGTASYKFTINKQTANLEYAFLKIDAPFENTGWEFEVDCPTGSADPAAGTAKITLTKNSLFNFIADYNTFWTQNAKNTNRPNFTAKIKTGHQFTITNTSDAPSWKNAGDGLIRIDNITLDTSKIVERRSGVSTTFGTQLTGTSYWVYDGVRYVSGDKAYSRNYPRSSGDENPTWENTLGTLPITIPRGESRTFTVFIDHPANSWVEGTLRVVLDIKNSLGTKDVPHNDPEVKISTRNLNQDEVIDPVAQTFFVDAVRNPSGIFVSSIDLWFAQKDNAVPVSVEIRPVVNGIPSSVEILPFGVTTVDAENITTSVIANDPQLNEYTRFAFRSPVYLPPGQYSFVVKGNSRNYRIYTARLGDFIYNSTTQRVNSQPYIGSMFKSQNASTWTPEQDEDIMFRINNAIFDPTRTAQVTLASESPAQNVKYDIFYTQGETLAFADTEAQYFYKTTAATSGSTLDPVFIPYQLGKNVPLGSTKVVKRFDGTSLKFLFTLSTADENIAPAVDLNRLASVLIKNIINDPGDAVLADEESFGGGSALARYITRRVTLNPGFEAQDLKVYLSGYCPKNTRFKVYCKVNAPGTTQFDSQNKYQEMTRTSGSFDKARDQFEEFIFENTGNTVLADGSYFNTFQIKIVMLSSDPAYVPYLRDLRVIALEDF